MNTTRTSLFLMANLGSEVSQIFSAKAKGNTNLFSSAMERAKAILLELKNLPDTKNNAEINILADVIDDIGQDSNKYEVSTEDMQSYFLPFAMRLMQV
ncbi:MAG: hypothetical protein A3G47_00535 [Candidatus Zambryskibacteria bacterium RIFCSPLOWO2_12_FULL_39_45]|uniref:Uncharacterized protein n=4 Tax=Bacteria candidate phyla TaxID=1783234 RepID=A0A1G2T6A7_9BACT|nr:MAG: hypothetical protein UT81_C0003G0005 [Parcubacteria group bacterium GW2011_GWA2_40_14]OGC76906.1 MAG: hypothetical protein A2619_02580 [candidate division WWE3 bacterium RIFOXYD1_FULL_39_9]OHA92702.1 MAG: hypothetical protein A2W58_01270 [Candidatus Zambryskibacteria bacterium RIFCSPHIGHO2_02_38_10.5]OHA98405.1 MAG: hypothetical protein A3E32_01810 [Candidatus Zambryskibacteria bacterium RIFCSPHIGHO2_12_FULL_38_37]OHB09173.1 MAG: hypothetical protein A2W64_01375 [Candidatus Zambryskibac